MQEFVQPVVTVSKCLGFAKCRYNGQTIPDAFVEKLNSYVKFRPVCPDVEIGLGVPRAPVRIISVKGNLRLMQPATGLDITDRMRNFADSHLSSLQEVDGFILKFRSPSCGIKEVKIYPGIGKVGALGKGCGFFGNAVMEKFPHLPVEDEGRLLNLRIREHFLTRLFTLASFRDIRKRKSMRTLVRFHTENKFLLMAYSQSQLRTLGKIVANHENRPLTEVLENYQHEVFQAFSRPPKYTSNINTFLHALGYVSKGLSKKEKAFLLDLLEKYRLGKTTLACLTNLLKSWIIRFEDDYLTQQTFFSPYPEELMELKDSGKNRNVWR
jgi:uncharacterized protein YbgA (DUF1722 family)/uncharacterized protein YbbK (DUF523 family)